MTTERELQGNVWRFEGVLDVDWELCPYQESKRFGKESPRPLTYRERMESLKTLCMKPLDPDFHTKVHPGDFLVGGEGMGYGHDHEHACIALRGAGIAAVLCESTNPNFRRNSIHHGLPVVVVKGIMSATRTGDRLTVSLVDGAVTNHRDGTRLTFKPFPDFILEILAQGGLYPWLREEAPGAATATG